MKYILKGDLFKNLDRLNETDFLNKHVDGDQRKFLDYIIHGCNAQGVMGSGFAKVVRENYPNAYKDYRHHFEDCGLQLGDNIFSFQDKGIVIVNSITQNYYGRNGKRYCDYKAIQYCFDDLVSCIFRQTRYRNITARIHYPKIGAGLGGGDWAVIDKIIDDAVDGQFDQYLHLG